MALSFSIQKRYTVYPNLITRTASMLFFSCRKTEEKKSRWSYPIGVNVAFVNMASQQDKIHSFMVSQLDSMSKIVNVIKQKKGTFVIICSPPCHSNLILFSFFYERKEAKCQCFFIQYNKCGLGDL